MPSITRSSGTPRESPLRPTTATNLLTIPTSETPDAFPFLTSRDDPPLTTTFKPAVKVLSRKPTPQIVARVDPSTGQQSLVKDDSDDSDSAAAATRPSPEELRLKAQRDREEKQRRYDEVRGKIFGAGSSGAVTPPKVANSDGASSGSGSGSGNGNGNRGGGGRNKGGRGRGGKGMGEQASSRRTDGKAKQLFDPDYTPKPGSVTLAKREGDEATNGDVPGVIRAPRGPDGSGRGGFGFAGRGGKGE